jgi:glycosyltransferase involved in cell wall biosynthesis
MTIAGKPHICFVAPDTWPILADDRRVPVAGGAQVQQTLLAKTLVRRGFRISMICMDYGQPDGATVDGVTILKSHKPDDGFPGIRFLHPRLTGLWSALLRADADIYYQRGAAGLTGMTATFAKAYGRRFIYAAAHDLDLASDLTWKLFQRRAGWRDQQLFRLGVKLCDEIVVQHAGQARDCERWYQRVPTLVPSCYDAQPIDRHDSNGVVLWVSTLRTWKRPELFLELARRLPQLRFRMVGGPAGGDEWLFARIRQEALTLPNMEFIGFVPFQEVGAHFNAARVFVNTSDHEGFPNTFLQAWSRRIPTVSFCNPGSQVNGATAANVARDLNEMTGLIEKLMRDDDYWNESGQRSRCCYETYHTPQAAVNIYSQIFERHWKIRNGGASGRKPRISAPESTAVPSEEMNRERVA